MSDSLNGGERDHVFYEAAIAGTNTSLQTVLIYDYRITILHNMPFFTENENGFPTFRIQCEPVYNFGERIEFTIKLEDSKGNNVKQVAKLDPCFGEVEVDVREVELNPAEVYLATSFKLSIFPNCTWSIWAHELNFQNPNRSHDIVIEAEGNEKFYVNKEYLASWSNKVKALINADKSEEIGQLFKNINPLKAKVLLESIHPCLCDSNKSWWKHVDVQAVELDMPRLRDLAAQGLIKDFYSSRSIGEQMSWVSGLPFTHSYVAASFGVDMGDKPTYLDRINNFAMGISFVIGMKYHRQLNQIFREKFGPDFPDVGEISGNSDLILISTDEFIDVNRPILPNLVHIGGLGLTDLKEKLDKVFETEMSKGELGVIYFSLGTIVNTTLIPNFALKTVLDTAKRFPKYHFIVKVDKYDKFAFDYASTIPNVFITGWVSQQPVLLAHPRLRVFITHAGYNGVIEAARAGVPLITMPFMFDQTKNSRAIATSGWGIALRRQSLRDQPEKLGVTVEEILTNEKYKQQALRIRRLIRNKPFNATERLIKWTEFVLSNGGLKELLVEGRNLDWFTYYNLDIFIPIILGIFVVVYLILKFVSFLLAMINGSPKVKTE